MDFIQAGFEILPFAKAVHLLKKKGVFYSQLVNLAIRFPEIFKLQAFVRVHFTAYVTLNSLEDEHIVIFIHHGVPFL
jgi:hypothetical protein